LGGRFYYCGSGLRLGLPPGLGNYRAGGKLVDLVGVLQFHKIRNIEEGVAFQAYIHESRLHAWENTGYAAFIDGSGQGVFVFALEVNLGELIVLDHPHFGLVRGRRHKQFFSH
jgi:hypothetical protein